VEPYTPDELPPKEIDWEMHVSHIGSVNRSLARYDVVLLGIINPLVLLSPLATHAAHVNGCPLKLGDVLAQH